jgi:hypothetical protein
MHVALTSAEYSLVGRFWLHNARSRKARGVRREPGNRTGAGQVESTPY